MTCELEFECVGIKRTWEELGRLGGGSNVNRGREVEIHYMVGKFRHLWPLNVLGVLQHSGDVMNGVTVEVLCTDARPG